MPVVRVVQAARAGAVRAALGNHVDVAARWLQQRRCHIDVVLCGGRRGADGAGEAGTPDEVPVAGACGAVSPVVRPLPPEEPHSCGMGAFLW